MPTLWVRNVSAGYDLTERISGLRWSSRNPGGDESCSFTFHSPWFADNPEIDRLDVIHVGYGLDVLWAGRIEEHDRGAGDQETIDVTAYGLGARLKDSTFREVYVDRNLERWQPMGRARRMALIDGGAWHTYDPRVDTDIGSGLPAVVQIFERPGTRKPQNEAYYYANGIDLASMYFDYALSSNVSTADTNYGLIVYGSDDDAGTNSVVWQSNLAGSASGTGTASGAAKDAIRLQWFYNSTTASANIEYAATWRRLAIFGNHGLTKRGTAPDQGFYASDLVRDIVGKVSGVAIRRIDEQTFVIEQMAFHEPTTHEDAIVEVNRYEANDWGTWGPDSPLATGTDSHFQYTDRDPTTQHWLAFRADCDDLDLHSETATLFNEVTVKYRDASGTDKTVTRTTTVPELGSTTRTMVVDGGALTETGANQLGDAILDLQGAFAPARGSVTLSRPVRHHTRGELPALYMRADGANLRIPDVLPSTTLFELDSDPDRRTTFPVKRVEVDASGDVPRVRAELDQSHDLLDVLQARLGLAAELVGV